MSARDYRVAVECALLGMAWRDHPDGDASDPLEPSAAVRIAAPGDWATVAELLLDGPEARGVDHVVRRLLAETRRIEAAQVGPDRGSLRGDEAHPSEARRRLTGHIARHRGALVVRLAASGPETVARYRSIAGVAVDGAPDCTLDVTLEPTTDGVMLGLVERHGDEAGAVEVVLIAEGDDARPRTLRLPASERSLVFYEERDPGAGLRAFAYRLE